MKKVVSRVVSAVAFGLLSAMTAGSTFADDWPLVGGDYWQVTGIHIKDGGNWQYAKWLASEWKKNEEFTKSKGWTKDYMILSNVHPREGEANIYLIRVFESIPSGPEREKRAKEYEAWAAKSNEAMEAESGNRAEFRTVANDLLLQRLTFRK